MSDPNAAQSTWTPADLEEYGYMFDKTPDLDIAAWEHHVEQLWKPISEGGLGLSKDGDSGDTYATLEPWPKDAKEQHDPTIGAIFSNIVNGPQGYLIAGNNISPADVAKSQPKENYVVPPLSKWSDIVALQWEKHSGQHAVPLKYVARSGIRNANTIEMIRQAFKLAGKSTVGNWPGVDFQPTTLSPHLPANPDTATQAFLGLLGSYHAAAPAYLLAQHHALFGGLRYITKIRVWSYEKDWPVNNGIAEDLYSSMLLYVSAVPSATADDEQIEL